MKRRLSSVRILAAIILLVLAAILFTHWPRYALCHIEGEELVGFDETSGLFFTTHLAGTGQYLNTYDLASLQRTSKSLPLQVNWLKSSFRWPCRMSDDRRFLIAASKMREEFYVFQLPSLAPVHIERTNCEPLFPENMGFSLDGRALIFRTREMNSDLIQVLDLDHPDYQEFHITYPSEFMIRGTAMNVAPALTMHLSSDRRYLAANLVGRNSALFDLFANKEVFRTDSEKGIARFTRDGQTLVFLPRHRDEDQEAVCYRLIDGKWTLSAGRKLALLVDEQILQVAQDAFVTVRSVISDRAWLRHLPAWFRHKLHQMLPPERLLIRFWNLGTGQPIPERDLDFPVDSGQQYDRSVASANFAPSLFPSRFSQSNVMVSADGNYIAWKRFDTISVWEASPRHSLPCWLSCTSLVMLACWVGYPRRA